MRSLYLLVFSFFMAAFVPVLQVTDETTLAECFPGWPAEYQAAAIYVLPLSKKEERFAANFPGRMGRFVAGKREIVIRWLHKPTRKLHPAADCYKGLGYDIQYEPIVRDREQREWGVFTATKGTTVFKVRERIYDEQGNGWTDVSSWYWAAILGNSEGPWWAITVAESLPNQGD